MTRPSISPDSKRARIQEKHLNRKAYVYIRQSSLRQVRDNKESAHRQYQFVEWAVDNGWRREQVVVVDEDQGHTATVAGSRSGFELLLAAVAKGDVGLIAALEASRLARNSPDWAQLLYIARYTATLVVDETGLYDPESSTDRMVLGIRGQVAEIEMDTSIKRMTSARWSKAERGELDLIPPAGYDLDELGRTVKTSDERVAHAVGMVFSKFAELGSARQVYAWW